MRRAILSVLLLSGVFATSGSGQAANIAVGTRVRIDRPQGGRVVGTLMSQTPDSIVVADPNAARSIVRPGSFSRIQTSGGRSHGAGAIRGLKVGALSGAIITTVVFGGAYLASDEPDKGKDAGWLGVFIGIGAFEGALFGTVIGGVIGAEKWNTVYPARMTVRPLEGNATGVGLAISF